MHLRLIALAFALPVAALAQSKPDPMDPKSASSPLRYESAFAGYRSLKQDKPAPWKEVNEAVKGATGHGEHSAPAEASKEQPSVKPPPAAARPAEHKH